jgi:hypothetical protein
MGMSIIAYFVSISPYSRNDLTGCEIGSDCDYKTKHCEATIKSFCLRGKSEFHFCSP